MKFWINTQLLEVYSHYLIFLLYLICFFAQLYFLLVIHKRLSNYKFIQQPSTVIGDGLSVIICARNEAKNLSHYLESILNQDFPNFEVIVVNDCSSDNSDEVLRELQKQYIHLKVVTIDEHPRYKTAKKFAATLGIKAAINDILVFTDADCKPTSNQWLKYLSQHYLNPDIEIVLGYSPYYQKAGVLNKLIRYETFITAVNYLSFTLDNNAYMGVGRNLSYRKSLFFKGKGFAAHMHILSGDDDLFVNQNATITNTAIEIHPESHVWSNPKTTWASYWTQKLRHLSAGKIYRSEHRRILTFQFLSGLFLYITFIIGLINQVEPYILIALFLIRYAVRLFIYFKPLQFLKTKDLLWWEFLLDILYYLSLVLLSLTGLFRKKTAWK